MDIRALVIGGTGLIGSAIVRAAPMPCDVMTRHERPAIPGRYDYIIHAAGSYPIDAMADARSVWNARLLADRMGARLVLISSGASNEPTEYGQLKGFMESLAGDAIILRVYSVVAPNLPERFALAQFIADARAGRDVVVTGTGLALRSYTWIDELGERVWDYANEDGVRHLSAARRTTLAEVACIVAREFGVGVVVRGGDDGSRPTYVPPCGFAPRVCLEEAIRRASEPLR